MRIFVTVGNSTVGFNRLLQAVNTALSRTRPPFTGVCQRGVSSATVEGLECVDFLSRSAFRAELEAADVVVCHAGVGTLAAARAIGHRPFVLPRERRVGESVDNHQSEIVRALSALGIIRPIHDPSGLARAFDEADHSRVGPAPSGDAGRIVLASLIGRPTPVRRPTHVLLALVGLGRSADGLRFHGKS